MTLTSKASPKPNRPSLI